MYDIARQLKQHREKHKPEIKSPAGRVGGLILGANELGRQDKDSFLALALESAQRLYLQTDTQDELVRFLGESPLIISEDGTLRDRAFLTQRENQALDDQLHEILLRLGEYWMSLEGLIVLEFFIKVFDIHKSHYKDLFILSVPWHATPPFARLMMMLEIPSSHPLMFLERVKETKIGLSEGAFIKRIGSCPSLVPTILNGVMDIIQRSSKSAAYKVFLNHFINAIIPNIPSKLFSSSELARDIIELYARLVSNGFEREALNLSIHMSRTDFWKTQTINELLSQLVAASSDTFSITSSSFIKSLAAFCTAQEKSQEEFWRESQSAIVGMKFMLKICFRPPDQTFGICMLPSSVPNHILLEWLAITQELLITNRKEDATENKDMSSNLQLVKYLKLVVRTLLLRGLEQSVLLFSGACESADDLQAALFHEIVAILLLVKQLKIQLSEGILEMTAEYCRSLNPTKFLLLLLEIEKKHQRWFFDAVSGIDTEFISSDLFKLLRGASAFGNLSIRDLMLQRDLKPVFSSMFTMAIEKLIKNAKADKSALPLITLLIQSNASKLKKDDMINLLETIKKSELDTEVGPLLKEMSIKSILQEVFGEASVLDSQVCNLKKCISLMELQKTESTATTLKALFELLLQQRPDIRQSLLRVLEYDVSSQADLIAGTPNTLSLEHLLGVSELTKAIPNSLGSPFVFLAVWQDLDFAPLSEDGSDEAAALDELLALSQSAFEDSQIKDFVDSLCQRISLTSRTLARVCELSCTEFLRRKDITNSHLHAALLHAALSMEEGRRRSEILKALFQSVSFKPVTWLRSLIEFCGISDEVVRQRTNGKKKKGSLTKLKDPFYSLINAQKPAEGRVFTDDVEALLYQWMFWPDNLYRSLLTLFVSKSAQSRIKWSNAVLAMLSKVNAEELPETDFLCRLIGTLSEHLTWAPSDNLEIFQKEASALLNSSLIRLYKSELPSTEELRCKWIKALKEVIRRGDLRSADLLQAYCAVINASEGALLLESTSLMTEAIELSKMFDTRCLTCVEWRAEALESVLSAWLDAAALFESSLDARVDEVCMKVLALKFSSTVILTKILQLASRRSLTAVNKQVEVDLKQSLKHKSFVGIFEAFDERDKADISSIGALSTLLDCLQGASLQNDYIDHLFNPWLDKAIEMVDDALSQAFVSTLRVYLPRIYGAITTTGALRWMRLVVKFTQSHVRPFLHARLSASSRKYLQVLEEEMKQLVMLPDEETPRKRKGRRAKERKSDDEDADESMAEALIFRTASISHKRRLQEEEQLDEEWARDCKCLSNAFKMLCHLSASTVEIAAAASLALFKNWLELKEGCISKESTLLDEGRLMKVVLSSLEASGLSHNSILLVAYEILLTSFKAEVKSHSDTDSFGHNHLPEEILDQHQMPMVVLCFMLARSAMERYGLPECLTAQYTQTITEEELLEIRGVSEVLCLALAIQDFAGQHLELYKSLKVLMDAFLEDIFKLLSPIQGVMAIAAGSRHSTTLRALFKRSAQLLSMQMLSNPADFVYTEGQKHPQTSELRQMMSDMGSTGIQAFFDRLEELRITIDAAPDAAIWLALILIQCPEIETVLRRGVPILQKLITEHGLYCNEQVAMACGLMSLGFSAACLTGDWTQMAAEVMEHSLESTSSTVFKRSEDRWVVYLAMLMGLGDDLICYRSHSIGNLCWSVEQLNDFLNLASGELQIGAKDLQMGAVDFWQRLIACIDQCVKPDKAVTRVRRQLGRRLVATIASDAIVSESETVEEAVKSSLMEALAFSLRSFFLESVTTSIFEQFFDALKDQIRNIEASLSAVKEGKPFAIPAKFVLVLSSLSLLIVTKSAENIQPLIDSLCHLVTTLVSFFASIVDQLSSIVPWTDLMYGNIFETSWELFDGGRLSSTSDVELVNIFNFPSTKHRQFEKNNERYGLGEVVRALNLLSQAVIRKLDGDEVTKFITALLGSARCGTEVMLAPLIGSESEPIQMKQVYAAKACLFIYSNFARNWGALAIVTTFRSMEDDIISVLNLTIKNAMELASTANSPITSKGKRGKKEGKQYLLHESLYPWFEVGVPALATLHESCKALNEARKDLLSEAVAVSNNLLDVLTTAFDLFTVLPRIPASGIYVGMYPSESHPSAELTAAWLLFLRQCIIQVLELAMQDPTLLSFAYSKFLEKIATSRDAVIQSTVARCLHQCWVTHGLALLPVLSDSLKTFVDLLDSPDPETTSIAKAWILSVERITGESLANRLKF